MGSSLVKLLGLGKRVLARGEVKEMVESFGIVLIEPP